MYEQTNVLVSTRSREGFSLGLRTSFVFDALEHESNDPAKGRSKIRKYPKPEFFRIRAMRPRQSVDSVLKLLRCGVRAVLALSRTVPGPTTQLGFLLVLLIAGLRPAHAVAPTNDVCSGAEIIPSSAQFPYLTAVTDVTEATD